MSNAVDVVRKRVPGADVTFVVIAVLAILATVTVPRIVDAAWRLKDQEQAFVPKGASEPDATPPAGLERGSLLVRENLAPALRELEARSAGGRVRLLRIASDRIDAQVITANRRLRTIRHSFTGETQVLSDTSSPGMATRATFAWSEVDALAPRRITERATRGTSSRELSYLVLADAGEVRWSAFLSTGAGFTARADGRAVRPAGG